VVLAQPGGYSSEAKSWDGGVSWYSLLKYVHVLLAMAAVGSNLTYGIWQGAIASRAPEHEGFVLRGIKFIDDRVANPCYLLLLLTGLSLQAIGHWGLQRHWVSAAIILYVALLIVGLVFYTPALTRQVEAIEAEGAQSTHYKAAAARATIYGLATLPIILAIVFMMVVKPTL
jgi:uncharacterized membrane protein